MAYRDYCIYAQVHQGGSAVVTNQGQLKVLPPVTIQLSLRKDYCFRTEQYNLQYTRQVAYNDTSHMHVH